MGSYREKMNEDGYVIIRSAFTDTQIEEIRKTSLDFLKSRNKGYQSDAFNTPELSSILSIFDSKSLLAAFRDIVPGDVSLLHHSDIHSNFCPPFHDDTQLIHLDNPPDNYSVSWKDCGYDYGCYSVAVYLQDHVDDPGGLTVIPRSHKDDLLINRDRKRLSNDPPVRLKTRKVDVIIFDVRLLHRGNNSNYSDRVALYMRVGCDNIHGRYHSLGAITRQSKCNNSVYKGPSAILLKKLKAKNIRICAL